MWVTGWSDPRRFRGGDVAGDKTELTAHIFKEWDWRKVAAIVLRSGRGSFWRRWDANMLGAGLLLRKQKEWHRKQEKKKE